jgi:hypothetical protein
MNQPTSWDDVLACPCRSCRHLSDVYLRCQATEEFLYVHDCRMFGRGFCVVDCREVFVQPGTGAKDLDADEAVAYVLTRQNHCDLFVSSFPYRVYGEPDFRWQVIRAVNETNPITR